MIKRIIFFKNWDRYKKWCLKIFSDELYPYEKNKSVYFMLEQAGCKPMDECTLLNPFLLKLVDRYLWNLDSHSHSYLDCITLKT